MTNLSNPMLAPSYCDDPYGDDLTETDFEDALEVWRDRHMRDDAPEDLDVIWELARELKRERRACR